MTDRELMDKAWDYLASYTAGERPNASEVNDLVFALERRLTQAKAYNEVDLADAYEKGWNNAMLRNRLEKNT
jgi:hypothetical protein